MKKLLIIATALFLAVSCGPKGNTYIIKGTVAEPVASKSDVVALLQHQDGTREEAPVVDGAFTFTGEASDREVCRIGVTVAGKPAARVGYAAMLVPRKGVIKVALDKEESTVAGGRVNKALTAYNDQLKEAITGFQKKMDALVDSVGRNAAAEQVGALEDEVTETITAVSKSAFRANRNNAVGLTALQNIMHELSLEEMDELLEGAADFIKENESIVKVRSAKVCEAATAEGGMFKDFSGKTPDGKDVSLSDFVGKGKYALVDFWASWCGPCKREIPNIKEIYEMYGKKMNVVGVAVWDHDNSGSRKTMEELGMKWNQIFAGEDRTPTDTYGIEGIPHIILFAPDGTILKRGLRGEEMLRAVVAVME